MGIRLLFLAVSNCLYLSVSKLVLFGKYGQAQNILYLELELLETSRYSKRNNK